jgi:hypothetical protein
MIKKIGRYLAVDGEGFILPDVAKHLISPQWQALIDDIIRYTEENDANNIVSLYIRGSVPRGLAIDFVSDLDLIFIAKICEQKLPPHIIAFREALLQKHPFCNGIEWSIDAVEVLQIDSSANEAPYLRKLLKTQALHVWGIDVAKDFPKVKPGKEMLSHTPGFTGEWGEFEQRITDKETQDEINRLTLWMGKRILRTAFEIASLGTNLFTRDLYYCYEAAAKKYPEIADALYKVLEISLEQNKPRDEILKIFSPVAIFLIERIKSLPD